MTIPISRELLEQARVKLKESGVDLTGDSGTFTKRGCTIKYAYDGTNLEIEVLVKPIIFTTEKIEKTVQEWVDQASGNAGNQPESADGKDEAPNT
jgi:hypothetical protein